MPSNECLTESVAVAAVGNISSGARAPELERSRWSHLGLGLMLATSLFACAPKLEPREPAPPELTDPMLDVAVEIEDPAGDLDARPLCEAAEHARLVGLGEATHGTREFRRLFRATVECLAASPGGLDVVFVEASHVMGLELDALVSPEAQAVGSPREYLRGQGVWDDEELAALVEWIREHNRNADRKIRIRGMDIYCWEVCPRRLEEHFATWAPSQLLRVRELTAPLKDYRRLRRSRRARDDARERLGELDRLLDLDPGSVTDPARELVVRLHQTLDDLEMDSSYPPRDAQMARNVMHELGPTGRGIVYAHNGHVWASPRALANGRTSSRPMGSFLRDELRDRYVVISTSMDRGRFSAYDQRRLRGEHASAGLAVFTVPPTRADSIEALLSRVPRRVFAVDLRRVPTEVAAWWSEPQRTRMQGNAWSTRFGRARFEALAWTTIVPSQASDLVVFFAHTGALHRLP